MHRFSIVAQPTPIHNPHLPVHSLHPRITEKFIVRASGSSKYGRVWGHEQKPTENVACPNCEGGGKIAEGMKQNLRRENILSELCIMLMYLTAKVVRL